MDILNKEFLVSQYMQNLDMKDFSIKKIKEDLKRVLHEEPAVEVEYKMVERLTEDFKEKVKEEHVKCINLYFTEVDDNTKKVSYIIE